MLSNLLWLFKDYREAKDQIAYLQKYAESLEAALKQSPNLVDTYTKQVLVDEPFPDGRIPDDVWLSPGENDRGPRAA